MYYNEYEDYMRNVLGYNNRNNINSYNENYEQNYYSTPTYNNNYRMMQDNIEDLYPDIYKIINPMVCKICENNTRPITNELVEQMTMEVYSNIEADEINIVNVNIETRESNKSKTITQKQNENREVKDSKKQQESIEDRSSNESRVPRINNPLLRDLIKILILNQLLGGGSFPGRPPVRPPFPRPGGPNIPPRPPVFPGQNPRPGMRDFEYDDYLNF